jgi:hypothetical protein
MRFVIAFVVVFGLIGLTAWLIRRFGQARIGESTRGRQPRLAVIEAGTVDGRRRLVLIRRDNVEHLLMIGGPTDIVVEQNIVRGQAATARPATYAERAAEPTAWPLQPEVAPQPAPAPAPVPRAARPLPEEAAQWSLEPAPMPRAVRNDPPLPRGGDALTGLAAELSARANGHADHAPPRVTAPQPAVPVTPVPPAPAVHAADAAPAGDQALTDMANRLEAALRHPAPPAPPPLPPRAIGVKPAAPAVTAPNGGAHPQAEAPQVRPDSRNPAPSASADDKKAFTSLEEEMASLLGRKG